MPKETPLYIFMHIPKCGGTSLTYHFKKEIKSEKRIRLQYPIYLTKVKVWGQNLKLGCKYNSEKVLKSLSEEEKAKIKIIYGHDVYYGIHKHFNRPYKYFCFIRNPIPRIISHYNYVITTFVKNHEKWGESERKEEKIILESIRRQILENGKITPFKKWLKTTRYQDNWITKFLSIRGFGEKPEEILNKFYFIGITENYGEDVLFLYSLLGINKFYENQNISHKYFSPEEEEIKLLSNKSEKDLELYKLAKKRNRKFKIENKDFQKIINKMRKKKMVIKPITIESEKIMNKLYKISSFLRKKSSPYSYVLDKIKSSANSVITK